MPAKKSTAKKTIKKKNIKKKTTAKAASEEPPKKGDLQLLKGMKDILQQDQGYWTLIRRTAERFARTYGFDRLDTPVLEPTSLFVRSTGKHTDIVEKEMFSFVDQGNENISLRPEFTPSFVRAYIEHGMLNLPQPVKMYTMGPIFRHDKPQAGRYRQFNQLNFEVIGGDHPVIDSELIAIQYFFLKDLGLEASLQINSIGCPVCRPQYKQLLQDYYRNKKRNMCNNCKKRYTRNPLRLLDCKEEVCQEIAQDAPQSVDYLCEECREHFVKTLEHLDAAEIPYTLNPRIVRGLDYYTKTAFEIFPTIKGEDKIESQSALGGGGRYDLLVEELGGREATGACGFALGIERIILAMKAAELPTPTLENADIFLAQLGESARKESVKLLENLRQTGFKIKANLSKEGLSGQLNLANKLGVKITLILGQKEMLDRTILLRDMETGAQEIIDIKKLEKELAKRLEKIEDRNPTLKEVEAKEAKQGTLL